MERFFQQIARRPLAVASAGAILTGAALLIIVDVRALDLRLRIETAVEKILPTGGPERELYQRFRDRFGNDELLFVGVVTDDIFTAENLRRVQNLTASFESLDGIRTVVSLSNAADVRAIEGEVSVQNVFDEVPEDPAALRALRERVLANPMLTGNVISADGRTTAFLLYPMEMSEAEFRERGLDREVERIALEGAPGAEILVAGTPPLKAATSRILRRDLFTFVPLNYLLMGLVGYFAFRSLRGTAIPLLAVGMAQLWTLAAMVLFGRSLNLITFIVPPLIIAVGFAYSVHTVSEHDEVVGEGLRGPEAVVEALRRVWFPIVLTALTTGAGFLSLCLSTLPAIREFGAFCLVGVMSAMIAALSFVPALLALLPEPTGTGHTAPVEGAFDRRITRLGRFVLSHRRAVLAVGAVIGLVSLAGLSWIEVSTSFTTNLKTSNPLRQDIHAFDEQLGGSITLNVVVESDEREAFKHPQTLQQVRSVQDWLEGQEEVATTTSLADYLMLVNRAFNEGDPESFAIPASKRLISQFLFFFWHDRLESLVDSRYSAVDILVRIPAFPSHMTAALLDRIEERLGDVEEPLRAFVTGDTPMIVRTIDDISRGQAISLSGATIIIYAILVLYFRSLRIALMALVPNVLPVLVYFGILGLTGVTLNIITSLIACIILGIAIDDTIHFLVRFREHARSTGNGEEAALLALRNVARPVTASTAALSAGFLALAVSGLQHMVEFAILAAVMLGFAWIVDVTFTPALCAGMGTAVDGRSADPREGGA